MRFGVKPWAAAIAIATLAALTGCAGFFPPNSTTSSSNAPANSGDYVYALNPTTNQLSGYVVGTNALTAVSGSPYTLPANLNTGAYTPVIAVSGQNTFLYVAGNGSIFGYSIGAAGALTPISNGAALATGNIASMDVSPNGEWLIVLDSLSPQLDEFSINTGTGVLTSTNPGSVAYPTSPTTSNAVALSQVAAKMVRISPESNFVVAALGAAGDVIYTFNESTGALAYLGPVASNYSTISHNAVAINSNDSVLYVATSGSINSGSTNENGVEVFTLAGNGATFVNFYAAGSSTVGLGTDSLAINKAGTYLYAGDRADQTIAEYSVSGSTLTSLSGSPFNAGGYVYSMARDNSGSYILAGSEGGSKDLVMYSMSSGTLSSAASALTGSDIAGLQIATTH